MSFLNGMIATMGKKPVNLDNLGETVANLIRISMDSQGIKQDALAGLSGLSQPTISRILNKKKAMPVDELDMMCKALGLVTSALVKQAEDELRPTLSLVPEPGDSFISQTCKLLDSTILA